MMSPTTTLTKTRPGRVLTLSLPQLPKSTMELLPTEAVQAIMCSLPDIASLKALALSCSTLYHSFKASESLTVYQILLNQIGTEVLPEAYATYESARIQRISVETTRDFAARYLSSRKPVPNRNWKLKDALVISRLHHDVECLAESYVEKALEVRRKDGKEARPSSNVEIWRTERALYRFEMYCNLFRSRQSSYGHYVTDQVDTFFFAFAPWETEQLACIHEYLVGLVTPAFVELASHDVLWGSRNIRVPTTPKTALNSEFIQALIGRGLTFIRSVAAMTSYDSVYKLIYSPYPSYYSKFLSKALKMAQAANFRKYSTDRIYRQHYDDPNPGPERAWRYEVFSFGLIDNGPRDLWAKAASPPREWGSVFWDQKRLDGWGFFDEDVPVANEETAGSESHRAELEINDSWTRRSLINLAGGSGWWSPDDESQIVWAEGRPSPLDDEVKRQQCGLCFGSVMCAPHRLVLKMLESVHSHDTELIH